MTELLLYSVFGLLLLHYIYFLLKIYNGLLKLQENKKKDIPSEFISIVIPFRNESEYISANLESLQNQEYPSDKFEIVYVNDFSEDNSTEILKNSARLPNIRVIDVPEVFSVNAHKKRAVRFGIENAKGDIIVTTDADCICPPEWLKTILSDFDENTAFVSAPVEFIELKGLFNRLQRLEFAGLVLTGAGLIGAGSPTICNAANITYRKSVYEQVGGFNDNLNLSSGDDELLMQKIRRVTNHKIKFCYNKKAVVKTYPNKRISDFYQQRKRWSSKGLFYADKTLILKLILIYLFYLSLPVQLAAGIFYSAGYLLLFFVSFILKFIIEYKILKRGTELFEFRKLPVIMTLAELLHIPYILIAGVSGFFGGFQWKGRHLKR